MNVSLHKQLLWWGAGLVIAGMIAYTGYYFFAPELPVPSQEIQQFVYERDAAAIEKLLKNDWYWLVEGDDFDVDFTLKTLSPNPRDSQYFGKLHIKVLHKDNDFVGFTTYYLRDPYQGQIQFLAVNPEFRGKGYGEKLMRYVLEDLKKMGAFIAILVTRTTNYAAQRVYEKTGFSQLGRDEERGLVFYEKIL